MDLFLCTLPNISDLLQSLESTILKKFIPAIGGKSIIDLERLVFSSSANRGLGLCSPSSIADFEFDASISITLPLIQIIQQRTEFSAAVLSDQCNVRLRLMLYLDGISIRPPGY